MKNSKTKKLTVICNNSGCVFLRDCKTQKEANREAISHLNLYKHDVSIVGILN